MQQVAQSYQALDVDTLPARLADIEEITTRLGGQSSQWQTREVGDGNLNLVFIVDGPEGSLVIKQALPYVRLVGESWPLPLKRSFFEYHALTRQQQRDPGRVPDVYYFDEAQALVAMEFLSPHVILRQSLMAGVQHPQLATHIGQFMARTLFRSSDLCMPTAERKADLGLFADNVELCDITENLVFTDPYFNAEQNRHTSPQLDEQVAQLRRNASLKVEVQHLKQAFCSNAETLLHGDLHTGSIMAHEADARVIDPEFALYGPMGFDVGMYIANLLMAALAQIGHESAPGERDDYRQWILQTAENTWESFVAEFSTLWHSERNGILYPDCLYGAQGQPEASNQALAGRLRHIWCDMLGFAGVEMHRRVLGLAHIAEFDDIDDADVRARAEGRALRIGEQLVLNRFSLLDMRQVTRLVHTIDQEEFA